MYENYELKPYYEFITNSPCSSIERHPLFWLIIVFTVIVSIAGIAIKLCKTSKSFS